MNLKSNHPSQGLPTNPQPVKCPVCLGRGSVAWGDHSIHKCHRCGGHGKVWRLGSYDRHAK